MGMADKRITDEQISLSSASPESGKGRLGGKPWIPEMAADGSYPGEGPLDLPYIEVTFESLIIITGLETMGGGANGGFVKSYYVEYKKDNQWSYISSNGAAKVPY